MNISLYQAASAMNATDRWQETIAENLAASSVPGFKKQEFSFAAVHGGLLQHPGVARAGSLNQVLMPTGAATTSFAQGVLRPTGNPTDLAMEGSAFFEVQLPNGTNAFSRDGEFHFNAQGQLATKEGYTVAGEGGQIQLDLTTSAPVTISSSGEVSQGAELRGKIKLTEFNDPKLLARISGGYFLDNHADLRGNPAVASGVRQGFLEASNASTVMEMANMMSAMRTFEANQRSAQIHDERIGRVIRELEPT